MNRQLYGGGENMKFKEFNSNAFIDGPMNTWFEENTNIKIIDIKYSADENSSNALVIYEEGE